jgi:hypothetical protein
LSLCLTNYALRHECVWGSRCIDPRFLDLGTSWRRVVSFTARPLYPLEKSPLYPTGTRTPTSRSSSTWLVAIPTTLSRHPLLLLLLLLLLLFTEPILSVTGPWQILDNGPQAITFRLHQMMGEVNINTWNFYWLQFVTLNIIIRVIFLNGYIIRMF